jgi:hypothetical protein
MTELYPSIEPYDQSGHRGSDVKRAWILEALARFAGR